MGNQFTGKYKGLTVIVITVLMMTLSSAFAGFDPDNIVEVRIYNIDREGLLHLTRTEFDIDGVWGNTARIYTSYDMLDRLEAMGYVFTIQRPSKESRSQGYHTYSELGQELKNIEAACPEICRLHTIGKSFEGRELWFVEISDNVGTEEDEPEFKYISTMHGDEPVGTELCLNLIHFLTEQYGTDSRITGLVSEMEIWIMPLMNPDGYVHGSRYNSQGTDLNRSFPDRVSDTYNTTEGRATETQHLMNWGFSHSPVLAANFHTGATVVNYPYDSDTDDTVRYSASPDDPLFIQLSLTYSSLNGPMYDSPYFPKGITNGVQWYTAYGGMQDWNYEWRGCNELTIELYDTKWPPYSKIPGLWEDNREAMLSYMEWSLRGIRGIVTDAKTGEPLDATVRIVGIEHDVYTDPDAGDYHRILLPGTYSIRFSAEGYVTKTVNDILVDKGNAARVDISLSQPEDIATLTNGVVTGGLSGTAGESLFFGIEVPPDQKSLIIDTWGTGKVTISARYNALPDINLSQSHIVESDNVRVENPESGMWYIRLCADEDFSDISVSAEYHARDCSYTVYPMKDFFDADGGEGTLLIDAGNGCPWTAVKYRTWIEVVSETDGSVTYRVLPNEDTGIRADNIRIADQQITVVQAGKLQQEPDELTDGMVQSVAGESGESVYYQFDVPFRQNILTIETSGGTGHCDLYVRYSDLPTPRVYDFSACLIENNETLTIEDPRTGKWYIMLDGYCSDISLKVQLTRPGVADLIAVLQILTGDDPHDLPTDFDHNGNIDIKDAIYMLRLLSGL